MKLIDPNSKLTLEELLDEIELTRKKFAPKYPAMKDLSKVPERTIRFYAEQKLLPAVDRGRGNKKYSPEFVWRVLFIRLLTQVHQLNLAYIGSVMKQVDVETMRRVLTGEEPLEIASPTDVGAAKRHAAKGYKVVALEPVQDISEREPEEGDEGWVALVDQANAVFRIRADLPEAKRRQLEQVAMLIQSIVDAPPVASNRARRK